LGIAMVQAGLIAGRITARGQPLALADVLALKSSYADGRRVLNVVQSTKTNLQGDYRLFWLPAGSYYLAVMSAVPDSPGSGTIILNPDGVDASLYTQRFTTRRVLTRPIGNGLAENEAYVPTFYPGTPDSRSARRIDVRPGVEVMNMDIDAPPVHTVHVRGTVRSGPLAPTDPTQARPSVSLVSADAVITGHAVATANSQQTTPVATDGTFDFPRVVPGTYVVQATVAGHLGRASVDVVDRDVSVLVTIEAGFNLPGRVVFEGQAGGRPDPRFVSIRVNLRSEPSLLPQFTSGALTADGAFTLAGIAAGAYRVYVSPLLQPVTAAGTLPAQVPPTLSKAYVKSMRMGERDVLREGIQLQSAPTEPLEIVIGSSVGILVGRVVDDQQRPVKNALVALLPKDAMRFRTDHRFLVTTEDGRFQFTELPPGDYDAFAWSGVERGRWQDPDFMRDFEDQGKSVHIEENGRMTVDLKAIR
jgi:hypothetical protein